MSIAVELFQSLNELVCIHCSKYIRTY
jgi:hypothetical protein